MIDTSVIKSWSIYLNHPIYWSSHFWQPDFPRSTASITNIDPSNLYRNEPFYKHSFYRRPSFCCQGLIQGLILGMGSQPKFVCFITVLAWNELYSNSWLCLLSSGMPSYFFRNCYCYKTRCVDVCKRYLFRHFFICFKYLFYRKASC